MSKIKVLALDIYGTVLASDDPENIMPPRIGTVELFDFCDKKEIKVASTSDSAIPILKIDLKESGVDIDRFDSFYCLDQLPYKEFIWVIRGYGIKPLELLVIGDSEKDIIGAKEVGARYIRVPQYKGPRDNLNLSNLISDYLNKLYQ